MRARLAHALARAGLVTGRLGAYRLALWLLARSKQIAPHEWGQGVR